MRSVLGGGLGQTLARVLLPAFDHAGYGLHALPGAPLAGSMLLLGGFGLLFQRDELFHGEDSFSASDLNCAMTCLAYRRVFRRTMALRSKTQKI